MLTGLSILGLLTGSILEPTPVGTDILRALDRATRWLLEGTAAVFEAKFIGPIDHRSFKPLG